MTKIQHDQNLMIVYAVEGYAKRHNLQEKDAFALFQKYKISIMNELNMTNIYCHISIGGIIYVK
jgi:hypothetical protein